MEGTKKVFTSELQTYISELKEVMYQKGYSKCQIQTYSKIAQTLGHADISSTEVYLRISLKQLSKCGLEVDL